MTSKPAGASRALSALGIVGDEKGMAVWTAALFLVTQSTHGLGANAADTLFFLRFGVDELPKMIALSGPVIMLMVSAHGVGVSYQGPRRWLPLVAGASATWVFLEWGIVAFDIPVVYPIIWVSTQGIIMLTFTMMWNAAGAVCNTRQAKRLFPLFATSGVVGGVLGNLVTGPIASLFGTRTLLLVQGSLLVASTFILMRMREMVVEDKPDESVSAVSELRQAARSIRSSKLLMLAGVVALLFSVLFYMVVFPFSESVASTFDTEAAVAGFLGLFSSIATASTFVVALLVAKPLFSRIGIVLSLMIVPVVYVLGFGLWLGNFTLGTASVVRGLQWVVVNAVGGTAFAALFNVLTGRRRVQVAAFMTAVPAQIGTVVGGLVLIASQTMTNIMRFGTGLVFGLGALVAVLAMRPAYLDAILVSVRKGVVGVFTVPSAGLVSPVDAEARRVLETHLEDPRPEARAYALSALARLQGDEELDKVASYLQDQSPVVRATAFDVICSIDPEGFSNHAASALVDETPEVRVRALHYAASTGLGDVAQGSLDDPDPRVRATAAVIVGGDSGREVAQELVASGHTGGLRTLLNEVARWGRDLNLDIQSLLHDDDAEVRAAAANALAALNADPGPLQILLDDPSLRVRRAAAAGLANSRNGQRFLIEILQVGTVNETDAALQALVPFDELTPDFVEWARKEAERAAELDELGRALGDTAHSSAARFLKRVLEARSIRIEQWVLMAMTTVETEEIMPLVQKGVVAEDAETRAQAIEALEEVGDRSVLSVLLPLLDRAPGRSDIGEREALRKLSDDFDPWLRALAIRCLEEMITADLDHLIAVARRDDSDLVRDVVPSLSAMPVEKSDTLGVMDRVLALQGVSMFSGLDPEDLEVLARSTREVAYDPAELVYAEGAEGKEALMIVSGSVSVSVRRDGEVRTIATYGPGESVGELALLGSGVRSADVIAGREGLHGVVITKHDFTSILEERPSVALGMLATLAARIVEET